MKATLYHVAAWTCAVLFAFNASEAAAQPTLTSADLPQGGQTYVRTTAVPPLFPEGLETSGDNLTWDFSDLVGTTDTETEYFPISAASLTTQFIFSSADHFTAFELPELGFENPLPFSGATTYHEFGSTYRIIGLGITTDIFDLPVIYDDEEELLPLPLTYGATLEGSSAFSIDLPELLFYETEQDISVEVDAWGTLLLPGASFECLRVRRDFAALDSVNVAAAGIGLSVPREGTVYEWYAAGEGMPVLSVQVLADLPAIWQFKPSESTPNGVTEKTASELGIHPNPCAPQATVIFSADVHGTHDVTVHDTEGKKVLSTRLEFADGRAAMDTGAWTKGLYIATLDNGQQVRFMIR